MKTGIIGLGSPHGDDQAGWEVIRHLQQYELPENITTEALDRPGPALIHYLSPYNRVILIDACDAGWPPGRWQKLSLNELLQLAELQGGNSHQIGVADSLHLAQITQQPLPDITLYTLQMASCEPMAAPSETVQESVSQITTHILQRL